MLRPTVKGPSVTRYEGLDPLVPSATTIALVAFPRAPGLPAGALAPTNSPAAPTRIWPVKELAGLLNKTLLPDVLAPPVLMTGAEPEITPVKRDVPPEKAFSDTAAPSELSVIAPAKATSPASPVLIVTGFAANATTSNPRANVPLPKAVMIRVEAVPAASI
jgi:hypothetical protein